MTEVKYRNSRTNHELEIVNHHDDIRACAGISAIAWALAGAVTNECDLDTLIMEDGHVHIKCVDARKRNAKALNNYFQMAIIGLKQIALEYPGTISFM